MFNEIIFDARELEAPEPLQGAVRHARKLEGSSYVKMIHRMRPCHLFEMTNKMNVWSADFEHGDDHLIFMAKDEQVIQYLKEKIKNEYGRTIA